MARPLLPIGAWGEIHYVRRGAVWCARARFRDADGVTRLVQRNGKTKGAARSALLDHLSTRTATGTAAMSSESSLAAVAEDWLATLASRRLAPTTLRRYEDALRGLVLPALGQLRLREITAGRVQVFLDSVTSRLSTASAKHARTVVSQIMQHAVLHGAVARNPARELPRMRAVEQYAPRALSIEDIAAIRVGVARWERGLSPRPPASLAEQQAEQQPRRGRPPARDLLDLIDVMLGTGLRIGEVLALRWSDVYLDDEPAVIARGTVTYVPGRKPRAVDRSEVTKTGDVRRRRLPRFAAATLLRKRVNDLPNALDAVFPSSAGFWRDPNQVRKWWRAVRSELGFDWVTPHTFRRTVATLLAREASLDIAAAQLGDDPAVAAQHYVERVADAPDVSTVLQLFAPREGLIDPTA